MPLVVLLGEDGAHKQLTGPLQTWSALLDRGGTFISNGTAVTSRTNQNLHVRALWVHESIEA